MSSQSAVRAGSSSRRFKRRVDGILLLDKPAGPSSNQVLQWVKGLFQAEKAGHTGTLDPFASGLLPIMFGEATKFSSFLLDASKEYEATLALGISTATGDMTGDVLERHPVSASEADVRAVVSSFLGAQLQTPPMHSALKRDGVPLYALARRGETVVRDPRPIVIEEISLTRIEGIECDIRVRCSKGTYIRVLGEDIGKALGCGATLAALRRTSVASFRLKDGYDSRQLESLGSDVLDSYLLSIDAGLGHLPRVDVDAEHVSWLRCGRPIPGAAVEPLDGSDLRLYAVDSGEFVGLGRVVGRCVQPVRLVITSPA